MTQTATSVLLSILSFAGTVLAADVITYEQFGAKGDGTTDDLPAIVAAHEAANAKGLPVKARPDAVYYIGGQDLTAKIMTDTDFGTAKFVIDDTVVSNYSADVFEVLPRGKPYPLTGVAALRRGMTSVGAKLPGRALVKFENKSCLQNRRTGNAFMTSNGFPQQELLIVNADGTLDPRTDVAQDMATVTKATAFPIDEARLVVRGGRFTTISTPVPDIKDGTRITYISRGILVRRSNCLIDGLEHDVIKQVPGCLAYSHFLELAECADVTVSNCVIFARRMTAHATYDLTASVCACVRFVNCRESTDTGLSGWRNWWAFGTNFCRDFEFEGCDLGRYDAHCAARNVTIRDCRFRYVAIGGSGRFLMENTTVDGDRLIHLRPDFGSNWDGDLIIRNCVFKPGKRTPCYFLTACNDGSHDYGYPCHMGRKILVDGLRIENSGKEPMTWFFLEGRKPDASAPHPYRLPEEVRLKGVTFDGSSATALTDVPGAFDSVRIVRE